MLPTRVDHLGKLENPYRRLPLIRSYNRRRGGIIKEHEERIQRGFSLQYPQPIDEQLLRGQVQLCIHPSQQYREYSPR